MVSAEPEPATMQYADMRIPVIVVTGFLGAGKTSLLADILMQPEFSQTALIVNEIGELGLDQDMLQIPDGIKPVLLAGGCLCCEMKQDLQYTLRDLLLRVQYQEIPVFKRIVIETTGLADPGPILSSLLGEPWLARRFQLVNVVTVVDLVNGIEVLEQYAEGIEQVVYADTLVLSKRDLVEEGRERETRVFLSRFNSQAVPILRTFPPDPLPFLRAIHTPRLDITTLPPVERSGHAVPVSSAGIRLGRLRWKQVAEILDEIAAQFSGELLRVKGILSVEENTKPVLIHGVRQLFHPPELLKQWPEGESETRLVFISRGACADAIAATFMQSLRSRGIRHAPAHAAGVCSSSKPHNH